MMHAPTATVATAVRKGLPRVHAKDDASTTLDPLMNGDVDAVVVLDESEHIVGLVTTADVQRAMTFLGTMSRGHRAPPGSRSER
jgi:Mg/Co/Ni transporter MgtE